MKKRFFTPIMIVSIFFGTFTLLQCKDDKELNTEIENSDNSQEDKTAHDKKIILKLLSKINELREELDIAPLVIDDEMTEAATIRANELTILFSHTRPDNSSYSTIFNEVGIKSNTSAENIARGQTTADDAFISWKNSDGHYKNMTNPKYNRIGIGFVESKKLWLLIFSD